MRSPLVLLIAIGAYALPAQGYQCTLVGTYNNHGPFNDVWGFVGNNGKEYCLLGARTGTVVLDCSNPANPVERGWFPWTTSTWRDIRTYGNYAYVVTESSSANGFQILDLTNPDAPSVVGVRGGSVFTDTHNVCIDLSTGWLYCAGASDNGSSVGTPVFDLSANPTNPPFLGFATTGGNSNYYHDLCVENGYGYGSMIYEGVLRIFDAANVPPQTLSESPTPASYTHNAWPNASGTLCATTDERTGGCVRFFDITNKSAPRVLSQLSSDLDSLPHNAFLVGDYCHVSWYGEGYVCIDCSVPSEPVIVAKYDTLPGQVAGGDGAWGCYPFQPSGLVYVSDQSTGLYIVRPHLTGLAIDHTPLADSNDEIGPYEVSADVTTGAAGVTSVGLRYRFATSGPFLTAPMVPTAVPDRYTAAIPGQDAPTVVEYYIEASDVEATRRHPRIGYNRFLIGTESTLWEDDFESNLGWNHGGTSDDWQRGSVSGKSGSSQGRGWMDPPLAHSGSIVYGNDLGPSGFNGSYPSNIDNWLQSPSIATNGAQGLILGYRRHLSLAAGDEARVLVNGQVIWSTTADVTDTYWQSIEHDIWPIANAASSLVVRFELISDSDGAAGGWTLDDVRLFTRHDCVPPFHYGTATPGTGGIEPQIALAGDPVLGAATTIEASQMLPTTAALLALGTQSASLPVAGIVANIDPVTAVLLAAPVASGAASWPFAVPSNPSLEGTYLYSQVVALDNGSPGGLLSASRGMRFRVCSSAP